MCAGSGHGHAHEALVIGVLDQHVDRVVSSGGYVVRGDREGVFNVHRFFVELHDHREVILASVGSKFDGATSPELVVYLCQSLHTVLRQVGARSESFESVLRQT